MWPYGPYTMGWGMWSMMVFGGLFWIFLLVLVPVIVVKIIRQSGRDGRRPNALTILEARYAKGEIQRDEFLRKKSDLGRDAGTSIPSQPEYGSGMSYYFSKTLSADFDDTVRVTTEALKREGFGIITDIDIRDTLKKKINADFRPYRILGACNPSLAHEALQIEDKVGTMLPCNVVVQDKGKGLTEVAAIDPVASMAAIDNPRLKQAAEHVRAKLKAVIASL